MLPSCRATRRALSDSGGAATATACPILEPSEEPTAVGICCLMNHSGSIKAPRKPASLYAHVIGCQHTTLVIRHSECVLQ